MIRVAFLLATAALAAEDPAAIMARVAANMESGTAARRQFVYSQRVKASATQSNGKLNRREERLYTVLPGETATEKKLERFFGEYRDGKKMIPYTEPIPRRRDDDTAPTKDGVGSSIDNSLMNDLVEELVDDKNSPDGIPRTLFPLRTDTLSGYTFRSLGEREWQGRRVYRIGFEPANRELCIHLGKEHEHPHDCQPWQGEAWIDALEFAPVKIDTELARGIPWAVRTFLGTNIQQLGFSITYHRAELPDGTGAWFPATYGTEFKLNVLFFYKRTIALSLESFDFRRVSAESTIQFEQ